MTSTIDLAVAGAIGAFGGSAAAPLLQVIRDVATSRREERHRQEDVRREAYSDATGWLIMLRDKIYSLNMFLMAATNGTSDMKANIQSVVDERWAEVSDLVVNHLRKQMEPLQRVASDRVLEAYRRLTANSTYWPTVQDVSVPVDPDEESWNKQFKKLRYRPEELIKLIKQREYRSQTPEEAIKSKTTSSGHYIKQVDAFIHLLRQEAGLSKSRSAEYLAFGGRMNLRSRLRNRHYQIGRWAARAIDRVRRGHKETKP